MARTAQVIRKTTETSIELALTLEGKGEATLESGIPFLDHMLTLLCCHGLFDLELKAHGDLAVDFHHTVDDIGIALGQAFRQALGDFKGIRRFGSAIVPMDEALASVALDISSRPHLVYNVAKVQEKVGGFDWELAHCFLKGFTDHMGITLHVNLYYGTNAHHVLEAIFKALGRALDEATGLDPRVEGIPSSKGLL